MPKLHAIHHRDDNGRLTSCEIFDSEGEGSAVVSPRGSRPGFILALAYNNGVRRAMLLDPLGARALRDYLIEFCDQLPPLETPKVTADLTPDANKDRPSSG